MIQLSMFDVIEDPITEEEKILRKALLYGSVTAGGNRRIIEAEKVCSDAEFVDFLKKEFYYSGHSMDEGFCNYSPKGLDIWRRDEKDLYYPWSKIAKVYREIIRNGTFA